MPLGDVVIHIVASAISRQISRGERAKVLGSMLAGAVVAPSFVYFVIRDADGDVVWGWVLAGFIAGCIGGALFGSLLTRTSTSRRPK